MSHIHAVAINRVRNRVGGISHLSRRAGFNTQVHAEVVPICLCSPDYQCPARMHGCRNFPYPRSQLLITLLTARSAHTDCISTYTTCQKLGSHSHCELHLCPAVPPITCYTSPISTFHQHHFSLWDTELLAQLVPAPVQQEEALSSDLV